MTADPGLAYIRGYYRVPARKGGRIHFAWPKGTVRTGTIVGSSYDGSAYLLVDFGDGQPDILHPTWQVTYLDEVQS